MNFSEISAQIRWIGKHLIRISNLQYFRSISSLPSLRNLKETLLSHAKNGAAHNVIHSYQQMTCLGMKPDEYVLVAVIKACSFNGTLIHGCVIHAEVVVAGLDSHLFVGSALINMYLKCGSLEDSKKVFDLLPKHDIVSWNSMLAGYAQYGHVERMVELFQQMRNAALQPNLATLNTLISGFSQHKHGPEALRLFTQMQQEGWIPDQITFTGILNACTSMEAHEQGKMIHVCIRENGLESDAILESALINMYVKCDNFNGAIFAFKGLENKTCVTWNVLTAGYVMQGDIQKALKVLYGMQKEGTSPDRVTWNTLLTGCVQHGDGQQAMMLFQQMQEQGTNPDSVTLINALKACTLMGSLSLGKIIHAFLLDTKMNHSLFINNAIIDMYAKCGSLDDASRHFETLLKRDIVSWNTIITSYAMFGRHIMVFECFINMQTDGLKPDEVTFLCMISACTHMGLLNMGFAYFMSMREREGLSHQLQYADCIIDMLARKGYLKEANALLEIQPLEGNIQVWTSLLSHCKTYGDPKLGMRCFDQIRL